MKSKIQEIKFKNTNVAQSHFDIVKYEDILNKKTFSHNQFQNHRIPFYVLVLMTKGSGVHSVNFDDYEFTDRSVFMLRKDCVHKFYQNNGEGFLFVFTDEFISYQLNNAESSEIFLLFNEILSSPKLQLPDAAYHDVLTLTTLIDNEYNKVSDKHSNLIIKNILLAIFSKLLRIKLKDNSVLNRNRYLIRFIEFQELVEKNCFNIRLVNFYANKMNISTKTLNNITQGVIQKTAKAFITDTFVIHIKRLIINSEASLREISIEVGFDEPTNFFKYFTKYAGLSPNNFRKICINKI